MSSGSIDDMLKWLEKRGSSAVSIKNGKGVYLYADDGWSHLAEAPAHKITGRTDSALPWAEGAGLFIQALDISTRRDGHLKRLDRRTHFQRRSWSCTITERLYVPDQDIIVCSVETFDSDEFCRLAGRVTEKGITFSGISLSIKQLYLLHQLLFHVSQKQTALELKCSVSHISQSLRELKDHLQVKGNEELIRTLSSQGLLPLLQHFELLFTHRWISPELKFG